MTESFAELFEESLAIQDLRPGSIVTGTIMEIRDDAVVVNAGLKSEGIVPISQFMNLQGELEVATSTSEPGRNARMSSISTVKPPLTLPLILPSMVSSPSKARIWNSKSSSWTANATISSYHGAQLLNPSSAPNARLCLSVWKKALLSWVW